jgi:GNAT superfamily N-acetyltransferase
VFAFDADVAYFMAFTERGGGTVVDADGAISWRSQHPLPFLVNSIVRADPGLTPSALVELADDRFRATYEILCLEGRDDDMLEHATSIGAEVGEGDPLQVLDDPASLGDPPSVKGVELRVVTDAGGVADIAAVNRDATAVYGFPYDVFTTVFERPATVLSPDIDAIVAYTDGKPVATAQVFDYRGTGYVGWVATARDAMRTGLGTLVTHEVIARSRARGATLMTLQASPMGAPVYRRMGFVDVGRVRGISRQLA